MKSRTFITIVFVIAVALPLCSCQKEIKHLHAGDNVRFTAGSGYAATKASYSGETNSGGSIERIDWQVGDTLRIYCEQASEPSDKYADYRVASVEDPTPGSAVSTAHIEVSSPETDGIGLRWGTGVHTFYAAFPSPATTDGITATINGNIVTADLSATQAPVDVDPSGVNHVAVPDLKYMLMTAKSDSYTAETFPDENTVFLRFTPLTTAVKFTITNQTKEDLIITSVSLTSASDPLNGPFTVDIDDTSQQPETIDLGGMTVSYAHTYPYCQYTGSTSDATKKTVTIDFEAPITLAYDADMENCGSLTFTFFLQPCQDFDDLTFKLVKSDGSWMSTRLGYTDGTGILFPRFKKSSVTGILVPEGAQWTIKYGPDVASWKAGDNSPVSPKAEVSEVAVVTSWDTGVVADLNMQKRLFEFVDLGLPSGTKWANMNIGATTETEYGDHYAWGELSAKSTYTLATYRWPSFGKYNETDNLYTLQAEDDVAHQLLCGRCHIPTRTQFEELFNNAYTTFTWQTDYAGSGTNGYLVTSKSNGNAIFLPAAGLSGPDGQELVGTNGCYWSSTLNPTLSSSAPYPSCAIDLDFSNSGAPVIYVANDDSKRLLGESIRPVKDRALPDEVLPGLFSVSATKQVRFSRGNLYWEGNAREYMLEANQYDYRNFSGKTNDKAVINGVETTTPANTVGSFFWVKNTEVNIKPYDSSYGTPSPADAATDILFTNNTVDTPNAEFVVNGQAGKYRTLSDTEVGYLTSSRFVNGGVSIGYSYSINITYCGVPGVVLYPDNYIGSALTSGISYAELPEGVVFLPASGFKFGNSFSNIGDIGAYLLSTSHDGGSGYNVNLRISNNSFGVMSNNRSISIALRPVVDVTEY